MDTSDVHHEHSYDRIERLQHTGNKPRKIPWDLRQMFQKAFAENNEKFGNKERIYITNFSQKYEETYIGFMSMTDPGTNAKKADIYDGRVFRGRSLKIRMSSPPKTRNSSNASDTQSSSKDVIEELTEEKNQIEQRIETERKRREIEK